MAYPASTKTLQTWVQNVDARATLLAAAAQQQKDLSSAGTLNMDMVRRFYDLLKSTRVLFAQAAAVSGIGTYLDNEKQGAAPDPVAEFNAMNAAVEDCIDWLNTNVPEGTFNATTYKLAFTFPADYTTPASALTYTAGQTAGYRTTLDALLATIG